MARSDTIPSPTLTPPQLAAVQRIAETEDGAWARAMFDGTAEAYSAHRGGLRRFAIDRDGTERLAGEIAATRTFRRARSAALFALALAAAGATYLLFRRHTGEPLHRWWLVPAVSLVAAFLIAAAFFGVHARLPPPHPHAGEWVGLPGPSDGDLSGHTMPGLVRAHPIFCGFWLLVCTLIATVVFTSEEITSPFSAPLGATIGVAVWWAFMLCFSRGWIKEGD